MLPLKCECVMEYSECVVKCLDNHINNIDGLQRFAECSVVKGDVHSVKL